MVLTLDIAPMIKPICDPIKNPPVAIANAWNPLKFFALAKEKLLKFWWLDDGDLSSCLNFSLRTKSSAFAVPSINPVAPPRTEPPVAKTLDTRVKCRSQNMPEDPSISKPLACIRFMNSRDSSALTVG